MMKSRVVTFGLLIAAMPGFGAMAAPSCGAWELQSDGSYWQQCVYDNGSQHCFTATDNKGSNSREISCKQP
jgi:hypothetical protein